MIQTSLILDGSAVMGLPRPEIPPTAHLGLRPYVTTFVNEYLHQSPLALLSVVVARNGVAQLASPLSTSEEGILASIETGYFLVNPPLGMMSLENSLRVALASLEINVDKELRMMQKLRQEDSLLEVKEEGGVGGGATHNTITTTTKKASNACQRKIVVVTGSVSVLDPGDVLGLIRDVCIPHNIVIDVVSLTGATRVLTSACDLTGGQFHCPLSGGGEHLLKIMETVALLRAVQSAIISPTTTTTAVDDNDAEEDALSYLLGGGGLSSTHQIGMKRPRCDDSSDDVDLSMVVSMGLPQSLYATNADRIAATTTASSSSPLPQSLGCIMTPPTPSTKTATSAPGGDEDVNIVGLLPDVRCPRCASVVSLPSVCPVCCLIVSSLPLMHTTYLTMNGTVSGTTTPPTHHGSTPLSSISQSSDDMISKLVVRCTMCGVQGVDTHVRNEMIEHIKNQQTSTSDASEGTSTDAGALKAQCIAILLCDRLGLEGDWVFCGDCCGRRCEQCHTLAAKTIGFCPTCL